MKTLLVAFAPLYLSSAIAVASPLPEYTFKGKVAPWQTLEIANQINGVVEKFHVTPGQRVKPGDLLVSIDDTDARIDVSIAKASLKEAQARLELARDVAGRRSALAATGAGTAAAARDREMEATVAVAAAERARANLAKANLALERTRIRTPISGTVGQLRVSEGAFVEAEGGTVLLDINRLDPILVSYTVAYKDRQSAHQAAGGRSVDDLLDRLQLTIQLPSGEAYGHTGRALYESARIDPATGGLTVWGEFPNPLRTLVPGLDVTIHSKILPAGEAEETQ